VTALNATGAYAGEKLQKREIFGNQGAVLKLKSAIAPTPEKTSRGSRKVTHTGRKLNTTGRRQGKGTLSGAVEREKRTRITKKWFERQPPQWR